MAVAGGAGRAEWGRHWTLVLTTAMAMSLAALLSAVFGVMLAPIEAELGWTRTEISSGPALVSLMGLVLAIPAGLLIDRFGARRCGILVVVLSCAAIASMSAVGDSLWHWWAAWGLFGISAAFTSTVWLAPVAAVFRAGRGMAIALTISGTGISMALAPGIAEYFVQAHGWRTGFLALAAMWFVVVMPLVLAFVPRTVPAKAPAEAPLPAEAASAGPTGMTPREGFTSPAFYLLFFAMLLSAMTGVALVLNLVPVLTFTGLSRGEAVALAGSLGVASILGRIVGGWLMDRFDVRSLAIWASAISVGFPVMLLALPGVPWAAFVGLMCYGLTGGMKLNAVTYLVTTHLGHRSFGLFYGAISITTTMAQGIGPLVANHVYDTTGSYAPVIWAAIPGFIGSGLLFFALRPPRQAWSQPGIA